MKHQHWHQKQHQKRNDAYYKDPNSNYGQHNHNLSYTIKIELPKIENIDDEILNSIVTEMNRAVEQYGIPLEEMYISYKGEYEKIINDNGEK